MRLYRAAAVTFVLASVLAAMMILAAASLVAQERTPQWLFDRDHIGEARAAAAARVAANARDAASLAWLARTYTRTGDVTTAIATAERAVAADARSMLAHLALAEALGEEAQRANVFRQLGLARRVRQALETALALAPDDPDAINGMLQYYLRAPGIVGGDWRKADQMAARLTSIDPGRGYVAQSLIAAHRKQTDRIEGLLLKGIEADSASVHPRLALVAHYTRLPHRHADAERQAHALLAIDATLPAPYRALARVYARAGRWRERDAIVAKARAIGITINE